MKRVSAMLVAFLALTALGQTITHPVVLGLAVAPTTNSYTFRETGCETVRAQWTVNSRAVFAASCNPLSTVLKLWLTQSSSCGDTAGSADLALSDVTALEFNQYSTGSFDVNLATLPGFASDAGVTCGSTGVTVTHRLCGSVPYAPSSGFGGCGTTTYVRATDLQLVYDTQPPNPPTIEEVTPQDRGLRVSFSAESDTAQVRAEYQLADAGLTEWQTFPSLGAGTDTRITVTGLTNYATYAVRLVALDAAGNESGPSSEASGSPIDTVGFWGLYKQAGGTDPGVGCGVGLGLMPVAAIAFALRRRARCGRKVS